MSHQHSIYSATKRNIWYGDYFGAMFVLDLDTILRDDLSFFIHGLHFGATHICFILMNSLSFLVLLLLWTSLYHTPCCSYYLLLQKINAKKEKEKLDFIFTRIQQVIYCLLENPLFLLLHLNLHMLPETKFYFLPVSSKKKIMLYLHLVKISMCTCRLVYWKQ